MRFKLIGIFKHHMGVIESGQKFLQELQRFLVEGILCSLIKVSVTHN